MPAYMLTIDTAALDHPEIPMPPVWTVRHRPDAPVELDVPGAALTAFRTFSTDPRLRPGANVAVAVGSRGVPCLLSILQVVLRELKAAGCIPFIVPAMGSHGGATVEGQTALLRGYGVTPDALGVPLRATMDVCQLGVTPDGTPVYMDANACGADAIVAVNRVKHHTDFCGPIESGIAKMLAIGLGKRKGAETLHSHGSTGLRRLVPLVARCMVERAPVVGGIAVIENAYGAVASVHGLPADAIAREPESALLDRSRQLAPRLPVDSLDVLVVDRMGKDVSGTGLDTHVIGRLRMPSVEEAEWNGPQIGLVCVLDLTEGTHGNASGFGLADVVTRRLVERIDWSATWTNQRTSGEGGILRSRMPVILETSEMCVRTAIATCGRGDLAQVRLAHIRDTEQVTLMQVTRPVLDELVAAGNTDVLEGPIVLDPSRAIPKEETR